MRKSLIALLVTVAAATPALAGNNNNNGNNSGNDNHDKHAALQQQTPRHVDLVIALDTSGSMDGLIDSARQKLWDVVNLLAKARPQPVLRVGVVSYGNDGYDASVGWVRTDADLTTDLDTVYARLFALRTNGGQEYVARAVIHATRTMAWSNDPDALRIIFVAGNEPATQDPQIPVDTAVGEARAHHIFVNAIYCGDAHAGEAVGWQRVAAVGHGQFAAIDQKGAVAIATPVDAELAQLSTELNQTYVAYGAEGIAHAENQVAQDKNALATSGAAVASRAAAKSSALYRAEEWDLVDARRAGKDMAKLPAASLPEPLRAMKPAEREAFVAKKAKERDDLQHRIADLSKKRDAFVQAQQKARAAAPAALDDAMGNAIKTEAKSAGFAF